jgi:murein L,D-transpeptidase YafK
MKTRSAYLALVAVALASLAIGVGFLYSLQPIRTPQEKTAVAPKKIATPAPANRVEPAGDPAARPSLFGLRTATAPSPAPDVAGLAVTTAPAPSKPPQPDATDDAGEFEGNISSLDAGPPKPPVRPAGLAEIAPPSPPSPPSPPRRPASLEALAALEPASPNEESAISPGATDQPGLRPLATPAAAGPDAPLPPARPRDLAGLAAVFPGAASAPTTTVEAPAAQQVARLPEQTLQAAPEDAFQAAPPKFGMGDPVFVRIFKQEGQLELWLKKNGRFHLYKTFPICKWSGRLGPKVKEADYQSPEGFYSVSARQLNPHSNYYRAFNVGYPNAFDKQNGRTGGLVMVHGACKSVGCFAMTDRGIEEIYGFVEAALRAGQRDIPVHIFPFRMTDANIARETGGGWLAFVGGPTYAQWNGFWRNLKEGYDLFEQNGEPPTAFACGDHYEFGAGAKSCRRIAGW